HLVGDARLLELVEVPGVEMELLVTELDLPNDEVIGDAVLAHLADVVDPERQGRLREDETEREEDGSVQLRASHTRSLLSSGQCADRRDPVAVSWGSDAAFGCDNDEAGRTADQMMFGGWRRLSATGKALEELPLHRRQGVRVLPRGELRAIH